MRIFSLVIGIIVLIVAYIASAYYGHHTLPLLGYFIGIILVLIGLFMPSRREMWQKIREKSNARGGASADPQTILKSRYVRGEITKEEYNSMKKGIENQQ